MAPWRAPKLPSANARRRGIALVVGIIVLVIGAASIVLQPPVYSSSVTLILLEPISARDLSIQTGQVVPVARQSGLARAGARVAGDVLVRIYDGEEKRTDLAAAGLQGSVLVRAASLTDVANSAHGPVLSIEVESSSAEQAEQGVALVAADLTAELAQRQESFDPRLSITLATATPVTTATVREGSRLRGAVAYGALALLAVVVTSWLLGRAQPPAVAERTLSRQIRSGCGRDAAASVRRLRVSTFQEG